MKLAVRYQSHGGNTKEAAEEIAKALNITAESIEKPIIEYVDLLIIGGGVYKWDIDTSLKNYLNNLNPKYIKSVAAFTTAGGMDKTKTILKIVKDKGINIEEISLPLKVLLHNHTALGKRDFKNLTEKQIQIIKDFVNKIIEKYNIK